MFSLYKFNLPNLKILDILQNCWLLNYQLAKRLFIDHAFLISSIRVEKNLKILLIKAIKNFNSRVEEKILNFINETLDKSYYAKQ